MGAITTTIEMNRLTIGFPNVSNLTPPISSLAPCFNQFGAFRVVTYADELDPVAIVDEAAEMMAHDLDERDQIILFAIGAGGLLTVDVVAALRKWDVKNLEEKLRLLIFDTPTGLKDFNSRLFPPLWQQIAQSFAHGLQRKTQATSPFEQFRTIVESSPQRDLGVLRGIPGRFVSRHGFPQVATCKEYGTAYIWRERAGLETDTVRDAFDWDRRPEKWKNFMNIHLAGLLT